MSTVKTALLAQKSGALIHVIAYGESLELQHRFKRLRREFGIATTCWCRAGDCAIMLLKSFKRPGP